MRRIRSLRFDVLETRMLLSKAHVAMTGAVAGGAPLVLEGKLTVDTKAASTSMNTDGSTTTTEPVAGRLGALGVVHGVWNESVDSYGDYLGPDTLRLHTPNGAFVLTFNNQSPGPAHAAGRGTVYYQHVQRLYAGNGAYAGDSESGTIKLFTNHARTNVVSLELSSGSA